MPGTDTALVLARAQFAFTISFHFLFPAFSIGLASYLAVLEVLWLKTGKAHYFNLFRYWLKIFALTFAMGVVSGIVMSYQFGTNWSVYADRAGPIVGPLMAYEVLTAFFLEAGFLGVMLFGLERVGRPLHFAATLMVALGTMISAFWILSVNSWMQTPDGWAVNQAGQFVPAAGWLPVIFNRSFPYRFVHTLTAAYLTTALAVGGVAAWHLLRGRATSEVRTMFAMAMGMVTVVAPMQILFGDLHGLNTLEHQPAKVMAMEGHFDSYAHGAPLILIGWPDQAAERTHVLIQVPNGSSFILYHNPNAPLKGLKAYPRDERPPVLIIFWSFRLMVGLGLLFATLGMWSLWARLRGRLYEWRWLHLFALLLGPAGFAAVIAGWVTAEVGRQPWVIYRLLRTSEAMSPIAAPAVGASLVAFVLVYFAVFAAGTWYILRLMASPPSEGEAELVKVPIRSAGITPSAAVSRPENSS
jgi:cytochrome d ubiquinol oxidase subunit I